MLASSIVGAAAPAWTHDVLAGYCGEAALLHASPDAIYIDIDSDVVGVISRHGVKVPCAVRTMLPAVDHFISDGSSPTHGSLVRITDGRIGFDHQEIVIGRIIDCQLPAIDPSDAAAMSAQLKPLLDDSVLGELRSEALQALLCADTYAVDALLGLGSGLTPLGDDVLCGWTTTLVAADHACADPIIGQILQRAHERTSRLSATLLRRAAAGEAIPEFTDLAVALQYRADNPQKIAAFTRALSAVGHTSGAGLLLGFSIALDHLAIRRC